MGGFHVLIIDVYMENCFQQKLYEITYTVMRFLPITDLGFFMGNHGQPHHLLKVAVCFISSVVVKLSYDVAFIVFWMMMMRIQIDEYSLAPYYYIMVIYLYSMYKVEYLTFYM